MSENSDTFRTLNLLYVNLYLFINFPLSFISFLLEKEKKLSFILSRGQFYFEGHKLAYATRKAACFAYWHFSTYKETLVEGNKNQFTGKVVFDHFYFFLLFNLCCCFLYLFCCKICKSFYSLNLIF